MDELFGEYQDRKMMKWNGFYLSEHTATLSKLEGEKAVVWPAKEQMSEEEINSILTLAATKNLTVTIQKEELDMEGHHMPDIVGKIAGFDDAGIFVGGKRLAYEEIRHVELAGVKKWSEVG